MANVRRSSSMSSTCTIVDRSVDLLMPSGERVAFRVEFGPVRRTGRNFRCPVHFHGWGDSPPDIGGYDRLQSLLLALDLVHAILADFVRHGGRVLWPGTSNDYDVNGFLLKRAKAEPNAAPSRRSGGQRGVRTRRKGRRSVT